MFWNTMERQEVLGFVAVRWTMLQTLLLVHEARPEIEGNVRVWLQCCWSNTVAKLGHHTARDEESKFFLRLLYRDDDMADSVPSAD